MLHEAMDTMLAFALGSSEGCRNAIVGHRASGYAFGERAQRAALIV
ncbi:hypothetical protein ACMHYB_03130 [Sorangium sp. So ce1128]